MSKKRNLIGNKKNDANGPTRALFTKEEVSNPVPLPPTVPNSQSEEYEGDVEMPEAVAAVAPSPAPVASAPAAPAVVSFYFDPYEFDCEIAMMLIALNKKLDERRQAHSKSE